MFIINQKGKRINKKLLFVLMVITKQYNLEISVKEADPFLFLKEMNRIESFILYKVVFFITKYRKL